MPLPRSTDVFVIGGGPAGLAAAIAARRRGFRVTVAESAIPPIDKACGEGIMPDGLEAARALGMHLEAAQGRPFPGIRFCESGITTEARFPYGEGLGIRRTTLHHHMVQVAADAGVHLAWGTTVDSIHGNSVEVAGRTVTAGWIVGADGGRSRVRRWAGLEACHHESQRFGFRTHFRGAPWTEFMELHWAEGCQLYITPVADDEVCVALLSQDPHLRLSAALRHFPEAAGRLGSLQPVPGTTELGAVTASRRLKGVWRDRVALVGDASGSVDAITGKGMFLLFQQSVALADALESGDLSRYQTAHRSIGSRSELMARGMLLLGRFGHLRRGLIRTMAWQPRLFAGMLAAHVGDIQPLAGAC